MSGNTAIGTTATGKAAATSYAGRFAPSPTGDLHLGSLLAAVGSYLDARRQGGRWLVRIEDLDTPRVVPGSADRILRTLDAFGLHWDGPVLYQSQRLDLYQEATDKLKSAGLTFECSCSRRELPEDADSGYPGTCRNGPTRRGATATRLRVHAPVVLFDDRIQERSATAAVTPGDFIIRRKDGIFAYQLAVVVDDAAQQITDVVRGADLLGSTARQIALQRALQLPTPRYAHLPVVMEPRRGKLAKSRHSVPLEPAHAGAAIAHVLRLLNHPPPPELDSAGPTGLLAWAAGSWNCARLRGVSSVTACHAGPANKLGCAAKMD